jgi:hypothetical protein
MSYPYPTQKYWGEDGEVSAVFRPATTPPRMGESGTGKDATHYLATTGTTGGEFGLYRVEMRPQAGGAGAALPPADRGVVLHPGRHGARVRRSAVD